MRRQGEAFSSRVLHYTSSLRGTKQYWQRQRSCLLSMVDTLGVPTIFFTHSAADLQWPELAKLICPNNSDSRNACAKAIIENPALADWFFYYRVMNFIKHFYIGVFGVTNYWLRFEWHHRGSPHVHGLAWLPGTPDVEQLLNSTSDSLKKDIVKLADQLVCTMRTLLFFKMAATSPMLQLQRQILISVIRCMEMSMTSMRTWLIWLPPASDIPIVQLPTASTPSMASKNADLDTRSPCSLIQLSSQRMSRLSSQLGMTG